MPITIIALGKLKEDYFKQACAEYEKRLSGFCKLSIIEIAPVKISQNPSPAEITAALAKEAELINRVTCKSMQKTFKVALCAEGERFTSETFAGKLFNLLEIENKSISFIIGSSVGLSREIKDSCDMKLSLSDMVFPHRLARVMLLEQVYRGFAILGNRRYHK
ncbi:MAG: 23S rRNA (pseudouridine(1915)-N(3))-methyltransferase RlmH [Oscillospiraceae bacterium]|nr:23S rRNA (pseudouridine(1915)-N(3))-methyltransferase RlmH [Oscillospiraceae bacterium]